MQNQDVRWVQRLRNFEKALGQLRRAADLSRERGLSDLERLGLVQAFEFTHELAWKTMKDFLEERGQSGIYGSKDATRAAFAAGLISDGDLWMRMIASRNETTHTYNEETVEAIGGLVLEDYVPALEELRARFCGLEKEGGT
jgi:nucleotidyltransferase substrate binding protein (TIGR01987 family)